MSKKVFIVAVGQLQGLRKQPFDAGDEVKEENFPSGHFQSLIERDYIKEKPAEVAVEEIETPEAKLAREAKDAEDAALLAAGNGGDGKAKKK